jgi:hypothetical protein
MIQITNITADARQQLRIRLPDNSIVVMHLEYKPQQLGWFITNLTWNTFTLNGRRITTSPNMLHQFKNLISFGLACFTTDNEEPMLQQDFSSGRASLYILSAAEVAWYTAFLANG